MCEIIELINALKNVKFDFSNEKAVQSKIQKIFDEKQIKYQREVILDANNIPDFVVDDIICVEVKIKGTKKGIYKQLERYSKFEQFTSILLLTNKAVTMPNQINGKSVIVLNLGLAWL